MKNVIIETGQRTRAKLFALLLTCPFLLFLGVYLITAGVLTGKTPTLFFLPVFMVILGIAIPIVEFRYRLLVTDDYVEQRHWRMTRIEFKRIKEVEVLYRGLVLTGDSKRLSVPGGINNRNEVYGTILKRLKMEQGVVIKGNETRVNSLLNS